MSCLLSLDQWVQYEEDMHKYLFFFPNESGALKVIQLISTEATAGATLEVTKKAFWFVAKSLSKFETTVKTYVLRNERD